MNRLPLCCILICGLCSAEYYHYRLPKNVRPLAYNLSVLTHLNECNNFSFEGEVSIRIEALDNTSNVTLHVKQLNIVEPRLRLLNINTGKSIKILYTIEVKQHDYYILILKEQLQINVHYDLKLAFFGNLGREVNGYFIKYYFDSNFAENRCMTATHFEPCNARKAFPCFDEPDLKARFTITIGHHKRLQAISNMPVSHTRPHETLKDFIWCEFKESLQMSTYLVAYSVNEYKQKVTLLTPSNVQFTTWPVPDSPNLTQVAYANNLGARVLSHFEKVFKIAYPLPKLDQLALPRPSGAMENWGLITYTMQIFSHDPRIEITQKIDHIYTVAHEVTHQWFGNLVTMKWWSDIWLNEAFASYLSTLALDEMEPQLEASDSKIILDVWYMLGVDGQHDSPAVSQSVFELQSINNAFNRFTYRKGSLLLRMLHHFIGNAAFVDGLRDYLSKHSYGNVERIDLWQALEASTARHGALNNRYSLATIMDSWILQPGYPIINVSRDYESGFVSITQRRFLNHNDTEPQGCWWIPLTYTTAEHPDFYNTTPKHWYACDRELGNSAVLELHADKLHWVIFNLQISGFYRVNYDMRNWQLLIRTLNWGPFQDIHVMNRAQLINDALMLAFYEQFDAYIALNLTYYLRREIELEPWIIALRCFMSIEASRMKVFMHQSFKRYMWRILLPVFKYLSGMDDNFDQLTVRQCRLKTLIAHAACHYGLKNCQQLSLRWMAKWRSTAEPDLNNPVPVQLRKTIYCSFMKQQLTHEDWKFFVDRFVNSTNSYDKSIMQYGFKCAPDSLNEKIFALIGDF